MTDTRRAKAESLGLLATNGIGGISAQDHRDTYISAFGGYGVMYTHEGSTAQNSINGTPAVVTGFAIDGLSDGFTVDSTTNNRITVDVDCVVHVNFQISFQGTSNNEAQFHIFKNGADTNYQVNRKLGTGTDTGSCSCFGLVSMSAAEYIDVRVSSPDSLISITPIQMQLGLTQIS